MKNWKYIVRLIGISVIGVLLLKMTYRFKYSTFLFDLEIFVILSIVGTIFMIWSLFTDLKYFRIEKKIISLLPPGLGIVFTILICLWNFQINANFNKPTLVRIFHDGDFNGTGIDFKTDGTYIFDDSAIGISDFTYGEYEINGNVITLDKNSLNNIGTNRLEIQSKLIEYADRTETEKYVYQIDENGNLIENTTAFRLVIDNRE